MQLFENGKKIAEPATLAEAKKMIDGLDYSMACVDCDPQEYVVKNACGETVYRRPRIHVP